MEERENGFKREIKRVIKKAKKVEKGLKTKDQLKNLLFEENIDTKTLSAEENKFYDWIKTTYNANIKALLELFDESKRVTNDFCFKTLKDFMAKAKQELIKIK